jgi:hypothetical protein
VTRGGSAEIGVGEFSVIFTAKRWSTGALGATFLWRRTLCESSPFRGVPKNIEMVFGEYVMGRVNV